MKRADLMPQASPETIVSRAARELGPWYHNLHLPDGTQTAPGHPLGDFPNCKWQQVHEHLPESLEGWTALDAGCNAGFYSLELARRGARVTAIDKDPHFLRQASWAIETFGLKDRIQLRQAQVYDLARTNERFDLVLFMGVFYHLRYPLLALDLLAERANRLLVFQTVTIPGDAVLPPAHDITIEERDLMLQPGWPKMAFIENALSGDQTNWWAPNHAGVESLLRSTGMCSVRRVAHEIYLCEPPEQGVRETRRWDDCELRAASGQAAASAETESSTEPAPTRRFEFP